MSKTTAQKRKPIRNVPFDEIRDNIQNNAKIITRSKSTQPERYDYLHSESRDDSNISTDEEEEEEALLYSSNTDDSSKIIHTYHEPRQRNEANNRSSIKTRYTLDNANSLTRTDVNKSSQTRTCKYSPKTASPTQNLNKERNSSSSRPLISGLLLVIILVLLFLFLNNLYRDRIDSSVSQIDFLGCKSTDKSLNKRIDVVKNTLRDFKSRYKNQAKDLWNNALSSIISIICQPKTPSIILLLGNTSDPLNCLARLFGDVSSNALNSHKLILTPENFESDMGSVIESLRSKIEENKVVIITDLLHINVEALKAFHNLCDRINPLKKEVIYIITIIADGYDKRSDPGKFIENELHEKLSGKMKDDNIQPLITRITDGSILLVQPEPTIEDCPLSS